MIWVQFAATALVIVLAGARLARYGDVLGEKTGLGRSWIGVVLLAATTSLPELFTGFGATALAALPNIALGDVLGSCMFNLLILSLMDAVQPEPLSAHAHQGHALSIGFGGNNQALRRGMGYRGHCDCLRRGRCLVVSPDEVTRASATCNAANARWGIERFRVHQKSICTFRRT